MKKPPPTLSDSDAAFAAASKAQRALTRAILALKLNPEVTNALRDLAADSAKASYSAGRLREATARQDLEWLCAKGLSSRFGTTETEPSREVDL